MKLISDLGLIRARAFTARQLITAGLIGPEDGLALTVWPTDRIVAALAGVPLGTLQGRAHSQKHNP